MKTQHSHKMILGLIAAMTLLSGCSADQLQRIRDTMDVALDTTRKAMDTVEQGAKMVQCVRTTCVQLKKNERPVDSLCKAF
jgi:uncharacterized lipoprotein YajG